MTTQKDFEQNDKITGTLENWSVVTTNPYIPPELDWIYLSGRVYDHEDIIDGTKIQTSRILIVNGPLITTTSGSVYKLGEPNPEYIKWCEKEKHHIPTAEEPIKVHKEKQ